MEGTVRGWQLRVGGHAKKQNPRAEPGRHDPITAVTLHNLHGVFNQVQAQIYEDESKFNSLAACLPACLRLCLCDANSGLLRLCVRSPLRIRPPSFVSFLPVSDLWPWITTEQCAACRWAWIMYRVMSHVYICIVCYTACTQCVVSERNAAFLRREVLLSLAARTHARRARMSRVGR